jgi:LysM repeat protein
MDNFSASPPPRLPVDEGSFAMKAFFILVLFILVFFLIISSSLAGVDLTPDTPSAPSSAIILQQAEPQVIMVQENTPVSPAGQTGQAIPVTGSCTNPYTVRPGDSLSLIGKLCARTTGALRLANPQISNINLIYPGQQLNIPGGSGTSATAEIPVTGDKSFTLPTTQPTPQINMSPTGLPYVPNTGSTQGILGGTLLRVQALNFPRNTAVNLELADQTGSAPLILSSGVTDANGNLITTTALPNQVSGSGPWSVVVYTTGTPRVQAASLSFQIIPR